MKSCQKQILALGIIVLFVLTIFPPLVSSENQLDKTLVNVNLLDDEEISLLHVEHYLFLNAEEATDTFDVRYVFPPDYQYQVPILLEVLEDSTADILHYQIDDDTNEPNNIVKFTIGAMEKDERVLIHFSCWVLVKNHEYNDLSEYVKIPKKKDLPEKTKIWLSSTDVVQTRRILIKYTAMQLRGGGDNLISFANNISLFIKEHRYVLFFLQLKLGVFFSQDAITTLFINGENVGRSHLACALLRSNNIPARVLLANNDQGFWTQMHYMVEYYCPDYGWVLIDPTKGETPYDTKRQVVNRVCYPEDEEDTKTDYIFPLMKGEERWIWVSTENVYPYYVDCNEGSKSQMFNESEITTDPFTADYAFFRTQSVFHQYEKYLKMNLTGENLGHLQDAISFQKQATSELQENDDINEYIYFIDKAYDEYKGIDIS
ncbi:MAG: transglutaminase-like domain-containing protein [Candidatus Thermoplasmatota archaeon]|nr:transglutaminase-like domain-containing protein [Candidatus Thermoplasmatota archaeon]